MRRRTLSESYNRFTELTLFTIFNIVIQKHLSIINIDMAIDAR